ncbi:AsmA-like C-terminal region-containing protein [Aestuariibaculum sp. YM273]|uniref:AsmA-like C-terminal region-containing protein n=1 Tax=Aestuariibaculum sp. YM273 TaxID=3070659 RepID=UPI0027DC6E4E|nr:AsmA-like C-terminal region-containing protein [Aestuariibaculum sp. YM273]WMI65778.1 AsmA-like C-terminal region-containing protein [Aestuariibaculum sp. YM273]
MKKWIKRLLIALLSIILLVFLAIAIVFNVIITPEKVTPKALELLNQELLGKVDCERIELTYFSSFPTFSLQLTNGALLPNKSFYKQDTLIRFKKARVNLSVLGLIKKSKEAVHSIELNSPKLFFYVDSLGNSNWNNLAKISPDTTSASKEKKPIKASEIYIPKIIITNAEAHAVDGLSKLDYAVENLNLSIKSKTTNTGIKLEVEKNSDRIAITKPKSRPYNLDHISVESDLELTFADTLLTVKNSNVSINDVHFENKGYVQLFPHHKKIKVNIDSELSTRSLKNITNTIPPRFLSQEGLKAKGAINLKTHIEGIYSKDSFPVVNSYFKIDNGSIAYKNFKGEIEDMNADIHTYINQNSPEESFSEIKTLNILGTGINMDISGDIKQLTKQPIVNIQSIADIDFNTITKNFPVHPSVTLKGSIHSDLLADFNSADLEDFHFNKVNLDAIVQVKDLLISSQKDSAVVSSENINFKIHKGEDNAKSLTSTLVVYNTVAKYKQWLDTSMKQVNIDFKADDKPTTLPQFKADIALQDFEMQATDSIYSYIKNLKMDAEFIPKSEKNLAHMASEIVTDSVTLSQKTAFVTIMGAQTHLKVSKTPSNLWEPSGNLSFKSIYAHAPEYVYNLKTSESGIAFVNDNITLNRTKINFGDTDMTLTGELKHARGFQNGELVTANLKVESNFTDANQLMLALAPPETGEIVTAKDEVVLDSVKAANVTPGKRIFRIPKQCDFKFSTYVKAFRMGFININDIHGEMTVKDGVVNMNNINLTTLSANMDAYMKYNPKSNTEANLDFRFYISQIDMNQINDVVPVMDTLFPAIKSFEGKADFRIKGNVLLNENLDFKLPTLRGVAALKARDIMVINDPAFNDVAKAISFKPKQKNPVKTFDAEVEFKKGEVQILPALLEVDKYRIALGGVQRIDMSYDYHVSVLKSPIPIKMGVDISGSNFSDYHIKLVKAKYKYYFTDKERLIKKADSSVFLQKERILKALDYN